MFGRFSTFRDVYGALVTTPEQKLSAIIIFFNFLALIPCVIYTLLLITIKSKPITYGFRNLLTILIVFVGFYLGIWTLRFTPFSFSDSFDRRIYARRSRGICFGLINSQPKENRSRNLQLTDSYQPSNNIVFIVDESIRGGSPQPQWIFKKHNPLS